MNKEIPVIIRISPSKQKAWRMLEHVYSEGDYQAERDITTRIAEGTYKLAAGFPTKDAHFDAKLLLARHHGTGKEARHLIFSTREMPDASPEEYEHALAAVVATALDFLATEAPGHDFILQPHVDRHHPHCHVVLCASDGQRCIDWKPSDLVRFQGLEFLRPETKQNFNLVSGRGRGRRPTGVGRVAYNSAVNQQFHESKERSLAERLDYELIIAAIERGELEVSRRTKKGKPLSVRLDGKIVRLSTLRKAAAAPATDGDSSDSGGSAQTTGTVQRRSRRGTARNAKALVRGR